MSKSPRFAEVEPAPRDKRRWLASFTLLEWGALLVYFYWSDRLAAYLHPNFRLLVMVTGILLLASAASVLCFGETCSQPHGDSEGCATRHQRMALGGLLPFMVLALPIALAAKISPDSFGPGFVQNRGVRQTIAADAPASSPASRSRAAAYEDYISVGILDLMFAANDRDFRRRLDGQRVGLTGKFSQKDETHFELIFTVVTCCAADAQLIGLRVNARDIPALEELAWTKVVGRLGFVKMGERDVPVIEAEKITATASPQEQLIY